MYMYVVRTIIFQNQQKFLCWFRVCSSTKENVQAPRGLSRSSSTLALDKLHSKKVKKHITGLRRAVSNTHLGTSRNFAPRTSWVSTVICTALVFVQFNLFYCLFTTLFSYSSHLMKKMIHCYYIKPALSHIHPQGKTGGWIQRSLWLQA